MTGMMASPAAALVACASLILALEVVGGGVEAHAGHSHESRQVNRSFQTAANDTEHIQEHLKEDFGMNVSVENMTAEEMSYYYFRLHDQDGNNELDGLEILKSWTHYLEAENTTSSKIAWDDLINVIDEMLERGDRNKNGYVDYGEYKRLIHTKTP